MSASIEEFARSKKLPVVADWMKQGNCKDLQDLDVFFRHDKISRFQAKKICSDCPVKEECLNQAFMNKEEYGVWGGLDEVERRSIARRMKKDRSAQLRAHRAQELIDTVEQAI